MKRNATIKLMIVAGQPAVQDRVMVRRQRRAETKLKLRKFETHRFTPKIQVLQDGSLHPPNQLTSSEWQQIGQMVHVIHRILPSSLSLIQTLPSHLC